MRFTPILALRKIVPFTPPDRWFKKQNILKFAFLFRGRVARCYKHAVRQVHKAFARVSVMRQVRRDYEKRLMLQRLDAACREHQLPNGQMLREGLAQCNVALDFRMLHILALYEPRTFASLVDVSKQYHLERGMRMVTMTPPQRVVTRGMLQSPVVPGNRALYE